MEFLEKSAEWLMTNKAETAWSIGAIGLIGIVYLVYKYGLAESKRRMRRLVKRREGAPQAEDFVLQQTEDGAMEVKLSSKAYKKLGSRVPIEGLIVGSKNKMVFRIRRA